MRVVFNYQPETGLWEPVIQGAEDETEARQAFSAVVLTCQLLDPELLTQTVVVWNRQKGHIIVPAT